jgi:nitroreductase
MHSTTLRTMILLQTLVLAATAAPVTAAGLPADERAAADHLLRTTRSVRKRLDLTRPVDRKTIEEAIDIAIQAPTGSNVQGWHFLVVTDAEKKKEIANLYRRGADQYRAMPRREYAADDPRRAQGERISASGAHLYARLHEVPAIVFVGIDGRVESQPPVAQAATYGSVIPAAWSFMLALRARGVGAAWTTLALIHERELAKLLGIPSSVTLAVMLPIGYYTGDDFKPAKRLPARERTYWNTWGDTK